MNIYLLRTIIPTHGYTRLPLLRASPPNQYGTTKQLMVHSRFLADITFEYLCNDWSRRIIRVAQVEPISKLDGPPFILHFVHECPIPIRDAEGCHTWNTALRVYRVRGMVRSRSAWTCAKGGEVCGRRVGRARRRSRGCERLIETLRRLSVSREGSVYI